QPLQKLLLSLSYFYTSISDPSQGLPQFVGVGYVDGQVFVHYDSHSRRMQPRVSWMEKVGKEHPQYRDINTRNFRGAEEAFRVDLETLRNRYNQRTRGGEGGSLQREKQPLHHLKSFFLDVYSFILINIRLSLPP
uniref:MHC class I-like antigen recognition-like domain-containing protein n=1 Tax=Pseudonaja textilis TaxID=8673 RepID=A0A670Z2W3_PSETE